NALCYGLPGLQGGTSLARLLAQERGARNVRALPPLTEAQILAWADAYHAKTGKWPVEHAGPIAGTNGEGWKNVDAALREGFRGLPGGSSLARFLGARRGVRNQATTPPLTEEMILGWADAHHRHTGKWPRSHAGPIADAPGETWAAVEAALKA